MLVGYEEGDREERHQLGAYGTIDEAVAVGRKLVDAVLLRQYKAQLTGKQLYDRFVKFGPDLYVDANIGEPVFNGWRYAQKRVRQMCGTW
ncbi:MAG: hypothetical protein ACJ8HQ_09645 [Chthoniobacterales bacterium]